MLSLLVKALEASGAVALLAFVWLTFRESRRAKREAQAADHESA